MYSNVTIHQKLQVSFFAKPDLGMFGMFGGTGTSQKEGAHRPQNVGQQRDIFWPVRASLWRAATSMRCSTTIWPINIIRLLNSDSHISNQVIAAKLRTGVTSGVTTSEAP